MFGIKPTFGLVPRAPGFFPPSWGSLAHTGPIGGRSSDVALLLEVIAGYDLRDAVSLPRRPASLRCLAGKPRRPQDRRQRRLRLCAGCAGRAQGFRRPRSTRWPIPARKWCEVDVGFGAEMLETVLQPIGFTEQATAVLDRDAVELARSDAEFRSVVDKGKGFRGTDYMAATHRRNQLRGRFLKLFGTIDALVTPTVAVTAFEAGTIGVDEIDGEAVDRHLGWSPFSWPINLAGLPAASVPCGFDEDGLPIGLQIVAPWLDEAVIFRIAAAFEAARPWAQLRPPGRA